MLASSLRICRRGPHKAFSPSVLVAALSAALIAAFTCFGGAGSAWADVASSETDVAQLSVTAPVKADAVLDPATGAVSVPASTIKNNGQWPIRLSNIGMELAEGVDGAWTATPEGGTGVELAADRTSASVGAGIEAGAELSVSWDTTFSGFSAGKMVDKKLGSWTWTFAPAAKRISFDANGGTFANGDTSNSVVYRVVNHDDCKTSHTANIDDEGNSTGYYASNLTANDVVTVPGAETLIIDVWYSTESTSWDWLAIYPAGIEPSASNYASATISGGKLGGGRAGTKAGATHKTFTVEGDTAQFFFRSDGGGNFYGYYAVVTGVTIETLSGTYNEPKNADDAWEFTGWNTAADGTGAAYIAADAWTAPSGCTLYAQYMDPRQMFAVYSADDKSLSFYNRKELPAAGDAFEGKTATAVWGGLENTSYSYNSYSPWYNGYRSSITSVSFVDDSCKPTSLDFWFYGLSAMAKFDGSKLDTSSVTSLFLTFSGCKSLTDLDSISNWDTSSVTHLGDTFYGCSGLANLDLSNWDTSSVTSLDRTFNGCSGLANLDLSNWDTSSVTSLFLTFSGCSGLVNLDSISNWDTSKVRSLEGTFDYCSRLANLNLSNWDTSSVTALGGRYYGGCFSGCESLTDLDSISNWDTSSVTNLGDTFYGCSGLTNLDLSNWDTSKVTSMGGTFRGCSGLVNLDLSNWDTSKITSLPLTFVDCSGLVNLDSISNWDTSKVTSLDQTFIGCGGLTSLDLSNWDTSSLTALDRTFESCSGLASLDLSNWDTSKVTSLTGTFSGCSGLTSLDSISSWDTSSIKSLRGTFRDCSGLVNLDLSNWDTSKVTSLAGTFRGCSGLVNLDSVSNWDTSKVRSLEGTFSYCGGLTSLDLSNWDTSSVTSLGSSYSGGCFAGCKSLTALDSISNWDTSSVTSLYNTFSGCSGLVNLDSISNWDTSKVTSLAGTFHECSRLANLDLSNWDTSKVTSLGSGYYDACFAGCKSLTNLDSLSNWDTSSVISMGYTFSGCTGLTSLDLSNWDTSSLKSLFQTFSGCSGLANLDLSNWDTSKVTSASGCFNNCFHLSTVSIGSNWKWLANGYLPTPYPIHITGADRKWYAASDGVGYDPNEVPSNKADTYYASVLLSPRLAGDASISIAGDASGAQLTCAFSTSQGGVSPSYSWSRDGMQIDGATGAAYSLTAADCGHVLTCTVTDSSGTKEGALTASYDVPAAKSLSLSANGGTFANTGAETSTTMLSRNDLTTKCSHTANIDDAGNATGTYASNLAANDVVTIPGAETLTIDVWYSTESTSYDWLAIYPAGIEPSANNYASATISGGKLGDGQARAKAGATHKTFTVEGDTAQFFFKSDGSGNYYGYYAVVSKGARYLYCIDGTIEQPVREGFTFGGWNTAADGSGRDVDLIDAADGEQLFAKWVSNDGDAEPGNDEARLAGTARADAPGAQGAENDGVRAADDGGAGSLGEPRSEAKSLDTSGETEPQAETSDVSRAIATSATAGALAATRTRRAG